MDVDDKVCEQGDITVLDRVYPKEVIERCVRESQFWADKERRVRQSTGLSLVWFVIGRGAVEQAESMPWERLPWQSPSHHQQ